MYRVSIICSNRRRGEMISSSLSSASLDAQCVSFDDLSNANSFRMAELFIVVASEPSELNLLPALMFTYPVFLLVDEEHVFYSDILSRFDRVFHRPYDFSILSSCAKHLILALRSFENTSDSLAVSDLTLSLRTRSVECSNRSLRLSAKEFELLEFFMINRGKALTRNDILESVWDRNANIFTNTVDVHVGRLRKKLDPKCSERFIKTIRGFGYIFSDSI